MVGWLGVPRFPLEIVERFLGQPLQDSQALTVQRFMGFASTKVVYT